MRAYGGSIIKQGDGQPRRVLEKSASGTRELAPLPHLERGESILTGLMFEEWMPGYKLYAKHMGKLFVWTFAAARGKSNLLVSLRFCIILSLLSRSVVVS